MAQGEKYACPPFIPIIIGNKVEKQYRISAPGAKTLRGHFKFLAGYPIASQACTSVLQTRPRGFWSHFRSFNHCA